MKEPHLSVIFSALFLLFTTTLNSQISCGTEHDHENSGFHSKSEYQRYLKFEKKFLASFATKSADVDTVYLHHQIVRLDVNTPAVTLEEIEEGMAYMNERFINSNIVFATDKVSYINDDSLFDYVEDENGEETQKRLTPGMVDIFYANTVEIGGNKVGGFAGGSRIVASSGGGPLLTHEMGHIFGLAHTHGKYGSVPPDYEDDVNGFPHQVYVEGAVRYYDEKRDDNRNGIFDCYETGAGVCDTPAEYVLLRDVRCYASGESEYNGNHRDYFGDRFEPALGNEMSYGCNGTLTQGQYARMRFIFETQLLELQCPKCRECDADFIVDKEEGKGSFTWAVACAEIKDKEATKNIILSVPGNKIIFEDRSYNLFQTDNCHIKSENGKTIIDGSRIENNTSLGLELRGSNISLKDIHLKGFQLGLNIPSAHDKVRIEDCIFEDLQFPIQIGNVNDFVFNNNEMLDCQNSGLTIESIRDGEFKNNENIFLKEPISKDVGYKIFNSVGALVKYGRLTHGENKIDVALLSGTYNLIIEEKEQVYASRILVLK